MTQKHAGLPGQRNGDVALAQLSPMQVPTVVEVLVLVLVVLVDVLVDELVLVDDDEVEAIVVLVVEVVPLTQADAVPYDDARGQPEPHACPAGQHVRLAPLPQGVVPAGQPHSPRLASMQAMPL